MNFEFSHLQDQALLDAADHPSLGGNINGPSLIRVPAWVPEPLGKYYLYFAHHEGKCIRLAYADSLMDQWTVYKPGALSLEESLFCTKAPELADMHPDIKALIEANEDGDYPHIASPDVHIDLADQKIIMYYHGRTADGTQQTRRAESSDGISFSPLPELLGESYFRVFEYQDYHYAIAWGSKLYRSVDGGYTFEEGPRLTDENYRHGAILQSNNTGGIHVIWSRAGDCPESLIISPLVMSDSDSALPWRRWWLGESHILHQPVFDWEGADEPLLASSYGGIMHPVNEVRDPCIYHEDGKIFLLYSVKGEQGIAMGGLSRL